MIFFIFSFDKLLLSLFYHSAHTKIVIKHINLNIPWLNISRSNTTAESNQQTLMSYSLQVFRQSIKKIIISKKMIQNPKQIKNKKPSLLIIEKSDRKKAKTFHFQLLLKYISYYDSIK